MTVRIVLRDRHLPNLPVHDDTQVRHIVNAVYAHRTQGIDRQFRVRRPAPSPNARRVVTVFSTSDVVDVNDNGVSLIDTMPEAVAA